MHQPVYYRHTTTVISTVILIGMICLASCRSAPAPAQQGKVFIKKTDNKYTLYRNGAPYIIKGAAGSEHLQQLQEAGGNTIRTWDTLNLGHILDDAQAHGIAVIAGFPMPVSNIEAYYEDETKVAAQYAAFQQIVLKYKSHPALLMWCLGNELDFPYKLRFNAFYTVYNRLLKMIHTADPDHPVTTALTNFERRSIYNIRLKVRGLDLISFNTFGMLRTLQADLDKFSWFWDGPFLLTEWGINGPWEATYTAWGAPVENTSTKNASHYMQLYQENMPVNNPRFLGACIFYWGQKQEGTPTWFSLFDRNGAASETVNVMQYLWTGQWPLHKPPSLKYMLVDGKGGQDNVMLLPNQEQSATLVFQDSARSTYRVHWEIQEEDWYTQHRYEVTGQPPAVFDSLLINCNTYGATFRTPAKEGPYRIFATVFDKNGYFASTNTPFYVVGQ
ncbi:glycoside hydrolase family 2 TIM barrel-domain containing protein [Chitinophaga defluvii]|uniref:Glycoside hydrolase family 2 TIM barrel-domain containing protein n=1 Tax=Chitinophaga defluvii TaxID=3163343 RepID=A0ABV2TBQ0_9BACT